VRKGEGEEIAGESGAGDTGVESVSLYQLSEDQKQERGGKLEGKRTNFW
jgi:hypothetical protein